MLSGWTESRGHATSPSQLCNSSRTNRQRLLLQPAKTARIQHTEEERATHTTPAVALNPPLCIGIHWGTCIVGDCRWLGQASGSPLQFGPVFLMGGCENPTSLSSAGWSPQTGEGSWQWIVDRQRHAGAAGETTWSEFGWSVGSVSILLVSPHPRAFSPPHNQHHHQHQVIYTKTPHTYTHIADFTLRTP